jgi:hypothetical protein
MMPIKNGHHGENDRNFEMCYFLLIIANMAFLSKYRCSIKDSYPAVLVFSAHNQARIIKPKSLFL